MNENTTHLLAFAIIIVSIFMVIDGNNGMDLLDALIGWIAK